MLKNALTVGLAIFVSISSWAESKHNAHSMLEECSSYCPNAKDEHAMHKCMKKIVKEKKGDAAFEKSECFHSVKEHEKNEEKHDH